MADNGETGNGQDGPLAQLRQAAGRNPITEKLYDVGEDYLKAKAQSLITSAGDRLNDLSEGGGKAGMAVKGAEKLAEGKSPASAAMSAAGSGLMDKVKGLFGKGKGKGGTGTKKVINIIEDVDVGVPVRQAYDQWTQFQEFTQFAKGVTGSDRGDDVESTWKFKIFLSNRSMKATISEQIPDQRIAWNSDGAKGSIKGVVTFHPLGENLTKILMVIEYYPSGLFEKTGNIWRAQGRRARLDLKHYRRFIMMQGEASDGWRGEIRDGEVVRTHEEAMEAEEAEQAETEGGDQEHEGEELERDEAEYDEEEPEEEEEEEEEPEEYDEDEYEEEEEEPPEDYDEDEYSEEEEEPEPRRAGAGRGRVRAAR